MGRHPRSLMLALGALTAFGPISLDVYLPSLPQLGAEFAASESLTQLTMSACMIGLALGQLLWGPISDRYGRRMPLMIGVAGFAMTSVLCAFAWNAAIVAEVASWGKTQLTAHGLGAYIAQATTAGDYPRLTLGIAVMSLFVILFNRLVWRPMYDFAERRLRLN